MSWEVVIGLETHAQLSTASKMFSAASTAFGAAPNTQASAVDIALPGVLPVANRGAVERAIRFGLAVNQGHPDKINKVSVFARKNYFYPDLPKGYQISQYEHPIVTGGAISIVSPTRGEIQIPLTRAHLEEDAGKSLHEDFSGATGIDLNRAGTPLLEIVSEPAMESPEEAVAYAKALHGLLRWIEICDGNMQEGSFRCDANVSVRRKGDKKLGTRCEIKNLNSFRFLQQAIEFEARRQRQILEDGGKIIQETRLYDPERNETRSMRTKEEAHDYRYFPDPDLPPLKVTEEDIERADRKLRSTGTPEARRAKYYLEYAPHGITLQDVLLLTESREKADYFARLVDKLGFASAKICANWVTGELAAALNRNELDISSSLISSDQLAGLLTRVKDETLSGKMAKEVFDAMWNGEGTADQIIEKRGLKQISDSGAIERIVDQVLAANARQVEDYRAGKDKAFNSLVGQVMKATQGKANPAQVNEILKRRLAR